jgi:RNA polymerase sigma-70 factor (ECF subfamily)
MIANIQTPDALLVQDYIAGNEESLSVLIRHESRFMALYIKLLIETPQMIFFTFIKVIKTLKSKSYNEEGNFFLGCANCS